MFGIARGISAHFLIAAFIQPASGLQDAKISKPMSEITFNIQPAFNESKFHNGIHTRKSKLIQR